MVSLSSILCALCISFLSGHISAQVVPKNKTKRDFLEKELEKVLVKEKVIMMMMGAG